MEKDCEQGEASTARHAEFAEHRASLARVYRALPLYGSPAFWTLLEEDQGPEQVVPLEVLVMVLRQDAIARTDQDGQRRLCSIIIARLQYSNEQWVKRVLSGVSPPAGEGHALAADLYADLCELLLRALLNVEQPFWQERFLHCLRFVRKHAYESFMRREGRWNKTTPGPGKYVPYALRESIDHLGSSLDSERARDVPDERAEQALLAVEQEDILLLLRRLPDRLRAVVWLLFWEGCTTRTVSKLLGISERTVRNRLQVALAELRRLLGDEQEVKDGTNA